MRIQIVFPVLPPVLDGIGDHTAHMATALVADGHEVQVLTAQEERDCPPAVSVRRAFALDKRSGILDIIPAVKGTSPDWLLLQFEQFSYGRWGFNPFVPVMLYQLRQAIPGLRIAVFFHEDYMPPRTVRNAVKTLWQLPQFWSIGKLSDVAIFPVEPRANRYRQWFPESNVEFLPVGSNIPLVASASSSVRRDLDIPEDAFVLGLFGSAHPARLLPFVRRAVDKAQGVHPQVYLLYVGAHGRKVRRVIGSRHAVVDTGPLSGPEASRCFSAMDVYLAPFRDGVSSRRGSFLTGIQHGIATVSTYGSDTGTRLLAHNGKAFRLTPSDDPEAFSDAVIEMILDTTLRQRVASSGERYYQTHHAWQELSASLAETLSNFDRHVSSPA